MALARVEELFNKTWKRKGDNGMNNKSGFLGFLFGGIAGAALTLLYAPRSGQETRQILVENSQEAKNKALIAIQEAQDRAIATISEAQVRIEELNQEAQERLTKLQSIGKATIEQQKQALEEGYQEAKEVVQTE
jgi:gas vesicle protein